MKRSKKLLILLVVLAVCVGGYFIVSHFMSDGSEAESIELTVSDIEKISWTYDGTATVISLSDDKWHYADDEDFPMSQDEAESLADIIGSLTATKKIADTVEDESKYGLDEPELSVTVTDADGKEYTYTVGSYNSSTGYYYMAFSEDTALYYVDSTLITSFSIDIMSLVDFEYLPITGTSDVNSISVTSGGKTVNIEYYPDGKEGYSDNYEYFFEGTDDACDSDTVSDMISGFVNINWLSCEAYNVADSDLSKYGLDTPKAQIELHYTYTIASEDETGEDETLSAIDTLLIGNAVTEDDTTVYYAMIKGGNCVYTVSEDTAALYMISGETALYSKQILNFTATELESINVTVDDKSYTVTAEEDLDEDSEMSYKIDGMTASLDTFVSYLEAFTAESVESSDITEIGDKLITITLNFTDSTSRKVEIYEYDADLCAVSLDGKIRYFVSENDCDDIYDEFRTAVKTAEATTE